MSISNSDSISRFRTLIDALEAAPADREFVTMWNGEDEVETISFGEFRRRARVHAARLLSPDVRPGDGVVLVMPQGIGLMAAFVGATLAGAVPAILAYPNFKVDPVKYRSGLAGVAANLKARVVMIDEGFPEQLVECLSPGEAMVVRSGGHEHIAQSAIPAHAAEPSTLAFIQHSAGTTGLQKGVAITHGALMTQLRHLSAALEIDRATDRLYSWLPLYHDMGLIACFMMPLVSHIPVVMQAPTDWVMRPRTMLELIAHYRCTLALVPNFALQFLARRVRPKDRNALDLSSLRRIINSGEPIKAQSIDEFYAAFASCGLRAGVVRTAYGMAENVLAVTLSVPGRVARLWVDRQRLFKQHRAAPLREGETGGICVVSSGRCMEGNEVRIVGDDGGQLPDGHVGEILVRSDSLFSGYYNHPELTQTALKDGWYCSGDLGFSWEGELYVIGRKKDVIIVAGTKIHALDIEEVVWAQPEIRDGRVVAVGLFDRELGTEEIVVVAELEHELTKAEEIALETRMRAAVMAELGVALRRVYLKPDRWIVKSTAGKPARAATRDKLLGQDPNLSDQ